MSNYGTPGWVLGVIHKLNEPESDYRQPLIEP